MMSLLNLPLAFGFARSGGAAALPLDSGGWCSNSQIKLCFLWKKTPMRAGGDQA